MEMESLSKEKELYDVMVEKLHRYFVIEKKEARIDTVIQILSVLSPFKVEDKKSNNETSKNFEEVDII